MSGRSPSRRHLLIAAAVALVAALASAAIVAQATSDDDDPPRATLTRAEHVPDVELIRFDGSPFSFAEYRGQPLVVNFFASTCAPCVREMPALEEVAQSLGDKVTFIGIAVQDPLEEAQDLVDRTGITYDTVLDPDGEAFTAFDGVVLPMTAFVDPDGTILDAHTGALDAEELRAKVSGALLGGG